MRKWAVQNGDWFLSEGPDWSVSTWTSDPRGATRYASREEAANVAAEARAQCHRPFGRTADAAKAVRLVD